MSRICHDLCRNIFVSEDTHVCSGIKEKYQRGENDATKYLKKSVRTKRRNKLLLLFFVGQDRIISA